MKVYWTDRAKHRLKAIHDYISEESPAITDKTVRKIVAKSRQSAEHPHAGRKIPEYQRNDCREILPHPYRVVYRIRSHQIDVLSVMHDRQLLSGDIEKR